MRWLYFSVVSAWDLRRVARRRRGADEPVGEDLRRAFDQADFVLHNTSMGESPAMMRAARKRGIP